MDTMICLGTAAWCRGGHHDELDCQRTYSLFVIMMSIIMMTVIMMTVIMMSGDYYEELDNQLTDSLLILSHRSNDRR